jgi:hypothetical protein
MYVFDTSALITVFTFYYRDRFPSLWQSFDAMIDSGDICMVEESMNEIGEQNESLYQ